MTPRPSPARVDLVRNDQIPTQMSDAVVLIVLIIVGGVVALFALWAAVWLIRYAFIGAVVLLAFAGEQGFVGLAAYVACWVFLLPVMLVVCVFVGMAVGKEARP